MANVLVVYVSLTGVTQQMAQYIAEGVRFYEHRVTVKNTEDIKTAEDLEGYDGYIFGSPTHHQDMAEPMKTFFCIAEKADMKGKLAGAFGSYTHTGDAPAIVLDKMRGSLGMRPLPLGSFNLLEAKVGTQEGIKACHDYGQTFGEELTRPRTEAAKMEEVEEVEGGPEEAPTSPPPWALT